MNAAHTAMISWVSADNGGPPAAARRPVLFDRCAFGRGRKGAQKSWTLVVDFEKHFKGSRLTLAKVRFLVKDAPHHLLHGGSRFELFEGPRRVAKGIVLPDEIQVPEEINEFEAALIG